MPRVLTIMSVSLVCASCSNAGVEPSQSLVGAAALPAADALSRETFFISRGGGPYGGDALTYEWRPDDSLSVTHTFSDNNAKVTVKGQETLRVAAEAAATARQLLWRLRPQTLQGVEQDQRPVGCERRGPHDFGEVAVSFVNEGDKPGIDDDKAGIFELPTAESCNTLAAVKAREVVWEALRLLPKSKVAAEFERLL